jgi:anti-sigma B factor antagonist
MPEQHTLGIYRRDHKNLALINLVGDLDLDSTTRLSEVLERCLHEGAHNIDIDVTCLTFCDVRGLRVLLDASAHATASGGCLLLHYPGPALAQFLALTGTDGLLLGLPVHTATMSSEPSLMPRHDTRSPHPEAVAAFVTAT